MQVSCRLPRLMFFYCCGLRYICSDGSYRVGWLKRHGWDAKLILFASVEDSDENRLIIATRPIKHRTA